MLAIFGFAIVCALFFYGPDPAFVLMEDVTKIVLIGISFFVAGLAMEVIFLIMMRVIIEELLRVFPGEKELCSDFANGMFTACFTLDQLIAPIVGSSLNSALGYPRTGTCYGLMVLGYFAVYWVSIRRKEEGGKENMLESQSQTQKEVELTSNSKLDQI